MRQQVSVRQMISFLDNKGYSFRIEGDLDATVCGFCSLDSLTDNCIVWTKKAITEWNAWERLEDAMILVTPVGVSRPGLTCIVTEEPKNVFFSILQKFWGNKPETGLDKTAIVKGIYGENVSVGAHTYIDKDVSIGEGTVIEHNVSIYHHVEIGKKCIIHSGTVIGADGFGYYFEEDGSIGKVEHFGGVVIGNNVEIGANTCVDRGTIGNTMIGDGAKIDNLVHIAHNAKIGKDVCVVAGAVVCGSATLDDRSYVAPGGIIKNQLHVGEDVLVGLGAVVTKDVEDGMVVTGVPAAPIRKQRKGDK